ncbi:hypothetical protein ALC62_01454 [Cyphomyrmex costatus]|uniref:Uncharacterized protein n=1 Tax=Cyphomyrmex costatus TaxID=456900 RepID=A0A195D5D3_9HYME|nr:hypothetical protein ALC62_01454 [Cyphomyrmex costatus]
MKCEINFEANQVDSSSFYRRGDSDGQIPALVPCQGKVDRIKLRRLLRTAFLRHVWELENCYD